MQFEGADRPDAGDEEQEAPGQVALTMLVLAAGLRFAETAVVLADHGLAPPEEADRAPARLVDRHWGMAHAVAHPAISRVLRPVVLFVSTPGRQLVRHHGLPVVGGEHHREAVQASAFAPVLAIGVQNVPCLLYTSDAADERSSVDLGGRRIIKKKTKIEQTDQENPEEKTHK